MKRAVKIIVIGVCLGLLLLAFQKGLQIDEGTFMHVYWIVALVVVLGAILFNLFYGLSYQKKMQKAAELLYAGKAQEYIDEIERLRRTAKGQALQNVLTLNLAAGYIEMKQFETAIPMLEELSGKRINGAGVKAVHGINLCVSYFETEQYEKAMALYEENQTLFSKYRNGPPYGGNIAVLDILAAIRNEQYEQAEQSLAAAQKTYDDPRLQKAFREAADTLDHKKTERRE